MSIEIKSQDSDKPVKEVKLSTAILKHINLQINAALSNSISSATDMLTDNLKVIEDKMLALESGSSKIMVVKVNDGGTVKLTQPAHKLLGRLIINAKLRKNTLLIGPAGCGKTSIARQLAETLKLSFHYLNGSVGVNEFWFFGRELPRGFVNAGFAICFEFGGVFLADELDGFDANVLLTLQNALDSDVMVNPISGKMLRRHKDFVCVATSNTKCKGGDEQYMREKLDAATINRFIPIAVGYDSRIEKSLCPDKILYEAIVGIRRGLSKIDSHEVVSYRTFRDSFDLVSAGVSVKDVFESIALMWNDDDSGIVRDVYAEMWPPEGSVDVKKLEVDVNLAEELEKAKKLNERLKSERATSTNKTSIKDTLPIRKPVGMRVQ